MDQEKKLDKLKNMRIIATSLLIIMSIIYITFKKFESYNIAFSCIVAFSEAAMIGALADWFAVVALFRHPMGMSWIPHTAIIQKNRDKIGKSLSTFVVSNFFAPEIIRSKLDNISFSGNALIYLRKNKDTISGKIVIYFPEIIKFLFNNTQVTQIICDDLKSKLKNADLYPFVSNILRVLISDELHIPIIKQLLFNVYEWLNENKEKTIKIIEGMNKTFALPFISDIIYKFIIRMLLKLIEDIENGTSTEFNREVLYNIPERLVNDAEASSQLMEKLSKLKNDILDSEMFNDFINEKAASIKESVISYGYDSSAELQGKISDILDNLADDVLDNDPVKEKVDTLLKDGVAALVSSYREEIAKLIYETVHGWPMEDMVEKLETQVGGDLQYIRINGTIIGGLAGLAIHLLSYLFI